MNISGIRKLQRPMQYSGSQVVNLTSQHSQNGDFDIDAEYCTQNPLQNSPMSATIAQKEDIHQVSSSVQNSFFLSTRAVVCRSYLLS